jgi:EmrB/QacA subfamily drug resistance transporter
VVSVSALIVTIDNTVLNVALPTLVRDLRASTSQLQWIVDAYILVFASLMLVGGSFGDRFGRARMLRIGLVVFGSASALAATSTTTAALVACRAVMGAGAAFIIPGSVAILRSVFPDTRQRARALGVWSLMGGIGVAIGPVLGGTLLLHFSWASIFLVNVPVALFALVVGWWTIPESRDPEPQRFDPIGVILCVLGISGVVWATINAPTAGWTSASTLGSYAFAFIVVGCFVAWELHCDHPMIELRFFRITPFSVANLTSLTTTIAWAGTMFLMTQTLQLLLGYSPFVAGALLMPLAVSMMITSPLSAWFAERLGTGRAVAIGLAIFAASLALLATESSVDYARLVLLFVAMGAGMGLTLAPTTAVVLSAIPRSQAGFASGMLSTTKQFGNALGVALLGSLFVSGYQSVLDGRGDALGVTPGRLAEARPSFAKALEVASRLGGHAGDALRGAARDGFLHGVHLAAIAGSISLAVGAAVAWRFLPARTPEAVEQPLEQPVEQEA